VKAPPFAYARANSPEEAVSLLAEAGDDAKVLAGGQSLVPLLSFRLARPSVLVDVNPLTELDYLRISDNGTGLAVGALCRHSALERRPDLQGPWRAFAEAVPLIGHYPIRARGTVGGSIAHADPSAELPVLCLAFDAEIDAAGPHGRRAISASDFFRGPFSTALAADELLVEARFPAPPAGARTVFEEFSERAGDFALASVCAGVLVEDGRCTWARIALGGVGPTPLRATAAEQALVGSELEDAAVAEAAELAAGACDPRSDFHASSEFRKELVRELTCRALLRASAGKVGSV
jgi:carbon-monoxide dehydrogenase medium subunit/6-hydroxypseudooxynicotine dehydrogenase subunit alpha